MAVIIYGLLAAATWGASDFAGGMISRRTSVYKVVGTAWLIGSIFIPITALIFSEPMISLRDWLLCAAAGVAGIMGLILLYGSLAEGNMSIAAAVSAVSAACIPVIGAAFFEGFPTLIILVAIALSLLSVWLVSQEQDADQKTGVNFDALKKPLLSGVGFGVYFVLMNLGSSTALFWPMAASRSAGVVIMLIFLLFTKRPALAEKKNIPIIFLNFFLDYIGTIFFILAGQTGRMDVASVVSSLYPGVTMLLACVFLKERLNRIQWVGIALALAAIVLFSL